jgi:hypothetical protein
MAQTAFVRLFVHDSGHFGEIPCRGDTPFLRSQSIIAEERINQIP